MKIRISMSRWFRSKPHFQIQILWAGDGFVAFQYRPSFLTNSKATNNMRYPRWFSTAQAND